MPEQTRVERSFRGISERLAIRYLTNLEGERIDEDTVVGEGGRRRSPPSRSTSGRRCR